MKAMVLAAGRGERLRPLTDSTPKPLLEVRGKPLIQWHLEAIARAGIREVVVNLAWLGEQIEATVGDGARFGLVVHYSREPAGALEAGGGIFRALPLLGAGPFLLVNGDVYTDFDFARLAAGGLAAGSLAKLVMVRNPPQHPHGDFALRDGELFPEGAARHTYSGLGLYSPALFDGCKDGRFPLLPLLQKAMQARALHGELHEGAWTDVGTVDRLEALNAQ
jgi:N-acetyl-alpha-D-muramate 1-phosphate uridylyltransferase